MGAVVDIMGYARDSLTNLVSRLGTDRDKAAGSVYATPILGDEQLLNAYRGAWLPRKIVDIPAFDSVRAWRDWQAQGDQIEKIEAEENRLQVRAKVLEARIKARLWGGAAIHIGVGDADLSKPLDVDRIGAGDIKYLTVLTRRQLNAGEIDREVESEFYGKPKSYTLTSGNKAQVEIHPSRLVIFAGNAQPDAEFIGSADLAWGDSVLLSVLDAIKQADGTAANIASLVFEAKIDIIRVPNFMASLKDETYKKSLLDRFTLAATAKGINGTLILDKEEEYESKSASFATLPDVLDRFLQIVSGAADIPATRLLGQSPAGMNATGISDMKNYHDRIASMQAIEMSPAMYRMDEAIIRSAIGSRPPEIYYEWSPLEQMSERERAEIFERKVNALRTLAGKGQEAPLVPHDALSAATCNMLIEDSTLPGFEAALEESDGLSEEDGDDLVAATPESNVIPLKRATKDAAPRTLYVRRDVLNAAEIVKWAEGQGFKTVQEGLHVTVIHTRTLLDWIKVGQAGEWSSEDDGKMTIAPGGPRLMDRFGDAVVLQFSSTRLTWRHEDIKRLGAETDFPEYQPHLTITWEMPEGMDISAVEPYTGKIELGPEIFSEVKDNWRETVTES